MKKSQTANFSDGFRQWSVIRPSAANDDDYPGGATPIALTDPAPDDPIIVPPEQPHRPWLVPGMGTL